MKRGLLTINSKRYNNLDNQQIKNRDMNTTKKWSLVAVLCGLFTATLLTACGSGMPKPDPTPEIPSNTMKEHTIEHIFMFEAERPIDFTWRGGAFAYKIDLLFNGEKVENPLASEISEEGITHRLYVLKAKLQDDGQSVLKEGTLESAFKLYIPADADTDYLLNKTKNPLTYTLEERIDGKTIKKESKTIVLDYDNSSNVVNIVSNVKF